MELPASSIRVTTLVLTHGVYSPVEIIIVYHFRDLDDSLATEKAAILKNALTCNVFLLDRRILLDAFLLRAFHSRSSKSYAKCMSVVWRNKRLKLLQPESQSGINTADGIRLCVRMLQKLCARSDTVVVKTIRAPVTVATQLLETVDNLKVVYYFRDPRGILLSRSKIHGYNQTTLIQVASDLCRSMQRNYEAFQQTHRTFPRNSYLLRYEDLAESTVKETRELFAFIDRPLSSQVQNWIMNNTMSASHVLNPFRTEGRNSSETANHWKNELSLQTISVINKVCSSALKTLGYAT